MKPLVTLCTEVTSEDDSDVCNLGSINLSNIKSLEEFKSVCQLGSKFLICGSLRADLPYEKVYKVREKTVVLDWDLWEFMHGSSNEDINMM